MIRMKSGATLVGADLKTPLSGPFEAEKSVEERLVARGVAEYVSAGVATPRIDDEAQNAGDNKVENKTPNNGDFGAVEDTPIYSVNSSANDLRKIAKEYGISFKVGTTKEEMVAALDALFNDDAPDLAVEDPV